MKISVKLEASENTKSMTVSLDELGIEQEEWESMTENQKMDAIKEFVYDLPEQPYWCIDKFTEKN